MDPALMKMAQEQFARMSPQQRAALQAQMANMDPAMSQQMFNQVKNMRTEDISAAMNQMGNLSPDQMAAAAQAANSQSSAQMQYKFSASEQLKAEGNTLFKSGSYSEASEKYKRALVNLEGNQSAQAITLRRMCQVNNASCYLKLSKWVEAETMCSDVLTLEPKNAKALYRRAQARLQICNIDGAVVDFRAALESSPGDETIAGALKDAEEKQIEQKQKAAITELEEDDTKTTVGGVTIEELSSPSDTKAPDVNVFTSNLEPTAIHSDVSSSQTGTIPPPTPDHFTMPTSTTSPNMMETQMNAMKQNPEMLKNMGQMMKDMDPEQLESLASMAGAGGMKFDSGMMKMAGEMMSKMKPEDLESMMKMQQSLQRPKENPDEHRGVAEGPQMPLGDISPEIMAQMEEKMNDPQNMEAMTSMMQNLSSETLM